MREKVAQFWADLGQNYPLAPKGEFLGKFNIQIFGKIQYFNLFGVARMPCYYTKLKNYP